MSLVSSLITPVDSTTGGPIEPDRTAHVAQLDEAIAELSARLHAATYELLVMLHEFDHCAGWNTDFLSCAYWLHWRTGIDLGAAREKVRVARALADLPHVSTAMRRGELSYAKVRALTRIATPEDDCGCSMWPVPGRRRTSSGLSAPGAGWIVTRQRG